MTQIIALEIKDFQRIVAVRIEPHGPVVEINGKNEAGKSSVLDAIMAAIRGGRYTAIEPIRRGAEKGIIKVDFGEFLVTRTFAKTKEGEVTNTVKITNREGFNKEKPQSLLNTLLPDIAYDPIEFAFAKPDDQYDMLKKLVVGVDIDALTSANQKDYDERTVQNRIAGERRAQAAGIAAGEVTDPIDEEALARELEEILAFNNQRLTRMSKAQAYRQRGVELDQMAARARAEVQDLKSRLAAAEGILSRIESNVAEHSMNAGDVFDEIPEAKDPTVVRNKMAAARAHNAGMAQMRLAIQRKEEIFAEAKVAEEKSKALTEAMEKRTAEAKAAVAAAKMPVTGLGFGEKRILYNDLPFEQANTATKIRVSIAVAAALSPHLKVALVRNGNDLDEDSWKLMEQFAAEKDHQIWIEKIVPAGENGFEIVDGSLKE